VPRVEVDKSLPPVVLPARTVSELLGHARETLPEECCGLIVGRVGERYRRLVRCRNEMTQRHRADPVAFPRDGRAAFWMNEADYMHTRDEAEAEGERVTAVYHSHVGAGAYLSEMDLDYARHALFPFPDADQIVVAVPSPDASHLAMRLEDGCAQGIGIFVWDADGASFRGRRVRPAAS
jgi:proteasome lid subunit RPN8/RPN11